MPENTQRTQKPDIHAPGGIRNHRPSKWAAADTRAATGISNAVLLAKAISRKTGLSRAVRYLNENSHMILGLHPEILRQKEVSHAY